MDSMFLGESFHIYICIYVDMINDLTKQGNLGGTRVSSEFGSMSGVLGQGAVGWSYLHSVSKSPYFCRWLYLYILFAVSDLRRYLRADELVTVPVL